MAVEEYITQIQNLLETDLGKAMEICEEALTKFPESAKLYYLKALILWNQSEVFDLPRQQFSALLKKATDLDPHYSAPHYLWAYANELLEYPELALRGYERAIVANPNDLEALEKVGEMKQKVGDLPGALETFDKLIGLLPAPSDRAYNNRGQLRREMKDYAGAIEDFNKVLEINPKAGGSFWGRGLCKKELGDLAGALEDFSLFITLFPQEIFGYMERAAVKELQNDLVGALKDYQAVVLEVDKKNDDAWEHIANLQNQLVQQIPEGTQVLHSTLKSGHTAMTAPIHGEMVLFLDMPQQEPSQPSMQECSAGAREMSKQSQTDFHSASTSINSPDQFGETLLLKAVKKGQVDEVKNLIAKGADVNFINQFKESVLMVAVKKNQPEIVKLLVETAADVNYKDNFGKSVLQAAQQKGFTEVAELLKSAGAKE